MGAQPPPPSPHHPLCWGLLPPAGCLVVSAATMLRGRPVQAIPYRESCVAAALAFCLCFLNLFTEKSFKLKVIKNFAVFDYF